MALWKAYTSNTQVAETAFNELLEINHRHSFARYDTAYSILKRLTKNTLREEYMKAWIAIKNTSYG